MGETENHGRGIKQIKQENHGRGIKQIKPNLKTCLLPWSH